MSQQTQDIKNYIFLLLIFSSIFIWLGCGGSANSYILKSQETFYAAINQEFPEGEKGFNAGLLSVDNIKIEAPEGAIPESGSIKVIVTPENIENASIALQQLLKTSYQDFTAKSVLYKLSITNTKTNLPISELNKNIKINIRLSKALETNQAYYVICANNSEVCLFPLTEKNKADWNDTTTAYSSNDVQFLINRVYDCFFVIGLKDKGTQSIPQDLSVTSVGLEAGTDFVASYTGRFDKDLNAEFKILTKSELDLSQSQIGFYIIQNGNYPLEVVNETGPNTPLKFNRINNSEKYEAYYTAFGSPRASTSGFNKKTYKLKLAMKNKKPEECTTLLSISGFCKIKDFEMMSSPININIIAEPKQPEVSLLVKIPETGASLNPYINFEFTKPMNTKSVESALSLSSASETAIIPAIEYKWSNNTDKLEINFNQSLSGLTSYCLKMATTAVDITAIPLKKPIAVSFVTAGTSNEGTATETKPIIEHNYASLLFPKNNAIDVATNTKIIIAFEEKIKWIEGLTNASFSLSINNTPVAISTIFNNETGKSVEITANNLAYNSTYKINVLKGISTEAEKAPDVTPNAFSFTTIEAGSVIASIISPEADLLETLKPEFIISFSEKMSDDAKKHVTLTEREITCDWADENRLLLFAKPTTDLEVGKNYTLTVAKAAKTEEGLELKANVNKVYTTHKPSAAEVSLTFPTTETGIATSSHFAIHFTKPIIWENEDSIASFSICEKLDPSIVIPCKVTFSEDDKQNVVLQPYDFVNTKNLPLAYNKEYSIKILSGIKTNVDGNPIIEPITFNATTIDGIYPEAIVTPSAGELKALTPSFFVNFTTPMAEEAKNHVDLYKDSTKITSIEKQWITNKQLKLTVVADLIEDETYTLKISNEAKNIEGLKIKDNVSIEYTINSRPLVIIQTLYKPTFGALDVSVDSEMIIVFTSSVTWNDSEKSKIVLKKGGVAVDMSAFTYVYNDYEHTLTITPDKPFVNNTSYTLEVAAGLCDSSVNAGNYSFTTREFEGGTGTETDPFIICRANELNAVRNHLTSGKYFKLGEDIDLSEYENWEPIGGSGSGQKFKGYFDGNNHTINNLKINITTSSKAAGLFGGADSTSKIENVTLKNCDITAVWDVGCFVGSNNAYIKNCRVVSSKIAIYCGSGSDGNRVGGIIGDSANNNIDGCNVECDIYCINVGVKGVYCVGGLVGRSSYTNITNCTTKGTINTATDKNNTSKYTNSLSIGGLIGRNIDSNLTNCISESEVYGCNVVGGLIGLNGPNESSTSSARKSVIDNCSAKGNIHGYGTAIGGLIGLNDSKYVDVNAAWTTEISKCFASGNVDNNYASYDNLAAFWKDSKIVSEGCTGGLIGINYKGIIKRSCSIGTVNSNTASANANYNAFAVGGLTGVNTGTIQDSYSTGAVSHSNSIDSKSVGIGGLIGITYSNSLFANSIVERCYSTGAVTASEVGTRNIGAILGETRSPVNDCFTTNNSASIYGIQSVAPTNCYYLENGYSTSQTWINEWSTIEEDSNRVWNIPTSTSPCLPTLNGVTPISSL